MSQAGLPVSRIVNVSVNLSPIAAQFANFDSLLIIGDSDVIDTHQRIRSYGTIAEVAADFGTTAPEYLAAVNFFGQSPTPTQLYIGRWAQSATHGLLVGGALTPTQQLIATWNAITSGSFKIAVDGGSGVNVTGLNFSAASNLNAVATAINTALAAIPVAATCSWDGSKFTFRSNSTGASSAIGALVAASSGVDISAMLKGTAGTLQYIVNGIVAETAVACVALMDALPTQWYGLMFASTHIVNADHLAIAAYVEAAADHIYGLTSQEAAAITSPDTTSIGALLHAAGYKRTFYQYSSSSAYAVSSIFGRQFTVDFNGNSTVITLMFKQEPGVTPEVLTSTQANTLDGNNYNYFASFDNQTAIIVNGQMAGNYYIDEIVGTDWLANTIQTDVYNLLYTSPTKIPQTDAGNHQIATAIEAACVQGVNNGLLAPGVWNSAGFGQLTQGALLSKGFYVYTPPIASQPQADREARKSVSFQVAAKLAGAVQDVDVAITVNR